MPYVICHHNEHAFRNAGQHEIYGPYESLEAAKSGLVRLVEAYGDSCFKLDPITGVEQGTYAGFSRESLDVEERDETLADEIWAEIVELS